MRSWKNTGFPELCCNYKDSWGQVQLAWLSKGRAGRNSFQKPNVHSLPSLEDNSPPLRERKEITLTSKAIKVLFQNTLTRMLCFMPLLVHLGENVSIGKASGSGLDVNTSLLHWSLDSTRKMGTNGNWLLTELRSPSKYMRLCNFQPF